MTVTHITDPLEARISAARQRMVQATSLKEQRAAWRLLCRLIRLRTPERVEQMERERGLRD